MTLADLKRAIAEGKRPDSYGAFLEALERGRASRSPDLQSRLLTILASRGPRSIAELVQELHAQLTDVLNALRSLREFGLVATTGDPTEGQIEITPSGSRTAQVIR